ncbi:molybdenum ABC transporter ATP-binding protein [Dongia sp.]|uniref:molybdenum ABC transporter ATP-binding protein n=1 Tax=Dongia sp. TaxID=1977262 RepID=UPI0035B4A790
MSVEISLKHRIGAFDLTAEFVSGAGITALFGRSGSGKTTLVNLMAGLMRPDSGRIKIGSRVLFDSAAGIDLPAHRRRIGYVFQEARLFPHLTVKQNLLYGAWFAKARGKADFNHVVSMLGIGALLARRPLNLSGGEKQRVAIGRALLSNPDILLMDEPLASLDDDRKGEILPYLERLRDDASIPIIYVTHAVSEIARLAASVVLLSDGKSIASGPAADILGRLDLLPFTSQDESGAGSLIDATVARHEIEDQLSVLASPLGELRIPALGAPIGTALRIQIKARDVMLSLTRPTDISALNIVPCRIVELREDESGMVNVGLDHDGAHFLARVTPKSVRHLDLVPGKNVYAVIKSVAFDRRHVGAWG